MQIGFLVFDGVTQLDFTGPLQVLSRAKDATIHIVAKSMDPVSTDTPLTIPPTATVDTCPPLDILVIPGGHGVRQAMNDPVITGFVATQSETCQYLTSVCTGAFILGKAGFLYGKKATTHWAYTSFLEKVGATYENARVVEDGNVITGGGVTAGIDFGFTLLARINGEDHARAIQLAIEYDPGPPFDGGTPEKTAEAISAPIGDFYRKVGEEFAKELEA